LDVLKLTAQFAAKHGSAFVTGLQARELNNPRFAFLKPTHSMRGVFDRFADAYSRVLKPPKTALADLISDEDEAASLERALARLEWERARDAAARLENDELQREREAFASIDWHDFQVVETIDFEDGQDDDLPEPVTLRDIIALSRGAEESGRSTRLAEKPSTAASAAHDVVMDDAERAMIDEGIAAARAVPSGPPGPAPGMKIVRDYKKPEVLAAEAKARAAAGAGADATRFAVSPITGELVAVDAMAEHMRVSLIDPKWKVQKEAMLSKLKGSTTADDDEVAANVLALARTRPDIFGTTDEEVSNALAESIEAKKVKTQGPTFRGGVPPDDASQPSGAPASLRAGLAKMPPPPPPPQRTTSVMPPPPAPVAPMPAPPPPALGLQLKAASHALPSVAPAAHVPVAPAPPPAAVSEQGAEDSKKRKIGETELLEESDFLEKNPGGGVIHVRCPMVDGDEHMNGQSIEVSVDSFSLPLSEFKKMVKDALGGLPANKQKISAPGLGFLTDKKTLAFYNLEDRAELTLTIKERGGRMK
jgi:splicing factor 3A subunit 1